MARNAKNTTNQTTNNQNCTNNTNNTNNKAFDADILLFKDLNSAFLCQLSNSFDKLFPLQRILWLHSGKNFRRKNREILKLDFHFFIA